MSKRILLCSAILLGCSRGETVPPLEAAAQPLNAPAVVAPGVAVEAISARRSVGGNVELLVHLTNSQKSSLRLSGAAFSGACALHSKSHGVEKPIDIPEGGKAEVRLLVVSTPDKKTVECFGRVLAVADLPLEAPPAPIPAPVLPKKGAS